MVSVGGVKSHFRSSHWRSKVTSVQAIGDERRYFIADKQKKVVELVTFDSAYRRYMA